MLIFARSATLLAARGSTWGGMVVGLIALAIFVVFSGWILAQRFSARGARRLRSNRKDNDD